MSDKKISQLTAATTPLAGTEVLPIVQSGNTVKASIANVQAAPVAAGTANAVQFLNASKVPSTNSNLFWNGTYFAIGGTVISRLAIKQSAATTAGGIGFEAFADNSRAYIYLNGTNWVFENSVGGAGSYQPFSFKTTAVERLKIDDASVTVSTGNLVIGTSGKGIDFSADGQAAGMTSELLDDYEEGTFTATLTGFSAAPTTPVTATSYYTKIGRQVTCQIAFNNVDTTGASGPILIQGMPFAAANTTAVGSCQLSMGTVTGIAFLFSGGTTIEILDATFYNNLNIAAGASKYAFVTITYTV